MNKAYSPEFFVGDRTAHQGTKRLSMESIGSIRRGVRWPGFDPREVSPGILHLGCGAFHRAHQNIFTQRAIELDGCARSRWGVVGVSFRSRQANQLLAPQEFLYSVLERGCEEISAEVVAVLRGILFAKEEQAKVIAAISDPRIRIVTLTVTPSGYSADPEHGLSPDAVDLLVGGLAAVRAKGARPPVLISCDNMPRNGRLLRDALVRRAALSNSSLGDWISQNVQCPCSVVDRIVPVPTSAERAAARRILGVHDLAAVATEPFRQWIIEDFDGPRPRWELAGAEFVSDVSPWEASKLNLLNGTHLAIAFLGILAGCKTVSDFAQDSTFARYACRLMQDEQLPTIPKSDHDLVAYSDQLLERWRNPRMRHQLQRIARNGSEKLQSRLLASLSKNIAAGRPAPCTVLAVAAWVCCMGRLMPFDCAIEDKSSTRLEELAANVGGDSAQFLQSILGRRDIFGDELPQMPGFVQELGQAIERLKVCGAREAVSRVVSTPLGDLA
jgi:fructuronate reductase